jgi:hypothetical protein
MIQSEPPEVLRFVAAAGDAVSVVERAETLATPELLQGAEVTLLRLYLAALELPEAEPSDAHEWQPGIPHDEWRRVYDALRAAFGPCDLYREVYDPAAPGGPAGAIEGGDEPLVSSLADDLADIWRDLRPGLRAWGGADPITRGDLVFEWRSSFGSHWGQHMADALRAIHWWRHVHHAATAVADV